MAENDLERELRRRFADLRAADDAKTPEFQILLARARESGGRRRGRRPGAVLALAGTGAAAAVAIFLLLRPSREPIPRSGTDAAAEIARWESPTGSLLETPGDALYREPPPATQPFPDWVLDLQRSPGAPAPSTPARKGAAS